MSGPADDLRYQATADLGRTVQITGSAGVSVAAAEALEPGRYVLRIVDFASATSVWVRQGVFGATTAAAAAPSTRFVGHTVAGDLNRPLLEFHVRPGDRNGFAVFAVGGAAVVQLTKVSRDRS